MAVLGVKYRVDQAELVTSPKSKSEINLSRLPLFTQYSIINNDLSCTAVILHITLEKI